MVDRAFWRGKHVFLTGHTGFKGGWLAAWLLDAGAEVTGYALPPDTDRGPFVRCGLGGRMRSLTGDVRDRAALGDALRGAAPDVVFHLAAQSLVRRSYAAPQETFAVNVLGTAHVLDAVRALPSVRAVVVVTSDKCTRNREDGRPMREDDPPGGDDPYSASKACAEIVTAAWRTSFFSDGGHPAGVATARAGNVIGGGDWAEDRIVPDAVRALAAGRPVPVRNPQAVRPWQHVLEPLAGYLVLAEKLCADPRRFSEAWNFGPREEDAVPVSALADRVVRGWGGGRWEAAPQAGAPAEARTLRLDWTKARERLGWHPRFTLDEAVALTVAWYRQAQADAGPDAMAAMTREQIAGYEQRQGA